MGVRSLWTYLRSTIAKTIHLIPEHPSQPLVIDIVSARRYYLDRTYIWDFTEVRRRVKRDVEALRSAGFDLLAVTASQPEPMLSPLWLKRRRLDLEKLLELNSGLTSYPEKMRFLGDRWQLPCNAGIHLDQAFHDAGCPIHISNHGDHEGAGLCIQHDAYGILTADTDFMIYPGIKRFLNLTTLRVDDGMILVDGIERSLFLRYLGVSEEKLPLIVGTKTHMSQSYHYPYCYRLNEKDRAMAYTMMGCCHEYPLSGIFHSSDDLDKHKSLDIQSSSLSGNLDLKQGDDSQHKAMECTSTIPPDIPLHFKTTHIFRPILDTIPNMSLGFLGNDEFPGLQAQDKRYLEYKWKLEWLPEAAAMEVNSAPTDLLPEASHKAMEYYKPIEPKNPIPEASHHPINPTWIILQEQGVYCQGVIVDSLSERPCHDILRSLRWAVYARAGLKTVMEYLCNPKEQPDQWLHGKTIEISETHPKAPEPPADILEGIAMTCSFLAASGELSEMHHQVLLLQANHRELLLSKASELPKVPTIKDLHVSSLFLHACELLYLGTKYPLPPCWDLFHGPLFHYLCQHPDEIPMMPFHRVAHDWTSILNTPIPETTQTPVNDSI